MSNQGEALSSEITAAGISSLIAAIKENGNNNSYSRIMETITRSSKNQNKHARFEIGSS